MTIMTKLTIIERRPAAKHGCAGTFEASTLCRLAATTFKRSASPCAASSLAAARPSAPTMFSVSDRTSLSRCATIDEVKSRGYDLMRWRTATATLQRCLPICSGPSPRRRCRVIGARRFCGGARTRNAERFPTHDEEIAQAPAAIARKARAACCVDIHATDAI